MRKGVINDLQVGLNYINNVNVYAATTEASFPSQSNINRKIRVGDGFVVDGKVTFEDGDGVEVILFKGDLIVAIVEGAGNYVSHWAIHRNLTYEQKEYLENLFYQNVALHIQGTPSSINYVEHNCSDFGNLIIRAYYTVGTDPVTQVVLQKSVNTGGGWGSYVDVMEVTSQNAGSPDEYIHSFVKNQSVRFRLESVYGGSNAGVKRHSSLVSINVSWVKYFFTAEMPADYETMTDNELSLWLEETLGKTNYQKVLPGESQSYEKLGLEVVNKYVWYVVIDSLKNGIKFKDPSTGLSFDMQAPKEVSEYHNSCYGGAADDVVTMQIFRSTELFDTSINGILVNFKVYY